MNVFNAHRGKWVPETPVQRRDRHEKELADRAERVFGVDYDRMLKLAKSKTSRDISSEGVDKASEFGLLKHRVVDAEKIPIPSTAKEIVEGWYSLGQIGQGSFGTVYKVTNGEKLGAAKVYKTNVERGKTAQQAFENETGMLKLLNHPNIPNLLETGSVADEFDPNQVKPVLVMDLIEGNTLEDVINQGKKFKEEKVVSIVNQMLATLAYAHDETGKVHRDLGPQNVMLAHDDKTMITDFGMAREPTDNLGTAILSQVEENKHRLEYIAPETLMGDPVLQSDLYSVAQIARALLKGEHVDRNVEEGELERIEHCGLRKFIEKNTDGRWKNRSENAEKALWDLSEEKVEYVQPVNPIEKVIQTTNETDIQEEKPFKERKIAYLFPVLSKNRRMAVASYLAGCAGGAIGAVSAGLIIGMNNSSPEEYTKILVGSILAGAYIGNWMPKFLEPVDYRNKKTKDEHIQASALDENLSISEKNTTEESNEPFGWLAKSFPMISSHLGKKFGAIFMGFYTAIATYNPLMEQISSPELASAAWIGSIVGGQLAGGVVGNMLPSGREEYRRRKLK